MRTAVFRWLHHRGRRHRGRGRRHRGLHHRGRHRGRGRGLHHGWRTQRFLGHVDDRALEHGGGDLLGKSLLLSGHRRDPTALHSFRWSRHRDDDALGLQRRPLTQVGAEHDLEVGPQRCQFRAQRDHLIGRLGPLFAAQLAAQVRLHRKLVLTSCGDLAVELQVVYEFHVTRTRLIKFALPAVGHRREGSHHRGPQGQDHRQAQQVHPAGEHQRRTREDRQNQQRRHEQPTGPAAATPTFPAAGLSGHGQTVPRRKCLPGATSWGDSRPIGLLTDRFLGRGGLAGRPAAVL